MQVRQRVLLEYCNILWPFLFFHLVTRVLIFRQLASICFTCSVSTSFNASLDPNFYYSFSFSFWSFSNYLHSSFSNHSSVKYNEICMFPVSFSILLLSLIWYFFLVCVLQWLAYVCVVIRFFSFRVFRVLCFSMFTALIPWCMFFLFLNHVLFYGIFLFLFLLKKIQMFSIHAFKFGCSVKISFYSVVFSFSHNFRYLI